MARIAVPLPSVRAAVGPAELVASRDEPLAAPAPDDGVLLRRSRAELTHRLDDRTHPEQPLHGEPHAGNCVRTRDGIRWIGIEGACGGPFGWDLAFVSHETRAEFGGIDRSPLDLLLSLGIACGATWCRVRLGSPGCGGTVNTTCPRSAPHCPDRGAPPLGARTRGGRGHGGRSPGQVAPSPSLPTSSGTRSHRPNAHPCSTDRPTASERDLPPPRPVDWWIGCVGRRWRRRTSVRVLVVTTDG